MTRGEVEAVVKGITASVKEHVARELAPLAQQVQALEKRVAELESTQALREQGP